LKKSVPIKSIAGLELFPTNNPGVCTVHVRDLAARLDLSWDRFIRLKAASNAITNVASKGTNILDVGGYDGALALFLSDYKIDLLDPATTGISLLQQSINASSYDVVAAIDVLEHVPPQERKSVLKELARITRQSIILNYPCRETKEAQKLVLQATNNSLIREHVEWDLPETKWVLREMKSLGFSGKAIPHGSLAVWVGQYMMLNLNPESAISLNRYLIENHSDEPFSTPLYHLIVCRRND
jgi:hypothetical protein